MNGARNLFVVAVHITDIILTNKALNQCCLNPCAARAVYIKFQAGFILNKIQLKLIMVCGRCCFVIHFFLKFESCLFFINNNIFRHLKLEIALAIPASNDEK